MSIKVNTIPETRLISWCEFQSSGQKTTIKKYIRTILTTTDTGLTCREISQFSGIEIQSLTRALQELVQSQIIEVIGTKKSTTNRMVSIYGIAAKS